MTGYLYLKKEKLVSLYQGTPGYTAPEVLRGDVPTFAADIYSLGIVAWQMLSREVPFHGLHIHTIIYIFVIHS